MVMLTINTCRKITHNDARVPRGSALEVCIQHSHSEWRKKGGVVATMRGGVAGHSAVTPFLKSFS